MKRVFLVAFAFCLLSSCLDSGDDETLDLQSPRIASISGTQMIAPNHFIEVPGDASNIPLAFQVEDENGISEIVIDVHSGFDGHTHGRTAIMSNFVLLNYNHTIGQADLEDPRFF